MRSERISEEAGIRIRIVEQDRVRYPPKPIRRIRSPARAADPDALLLRLDDGLRSMAERILHEGARGWRQWATLRRRSGPDFSPIVAEQELLDALCREAGLTVEDVWRHGNWIPQRFVIDQSLRTWLGIIDPEKIRDELDAELTHEKPRRALPDGPPRGIDWRSFAFVLRAAERLLDMAEHGQKPSARELAGLIDHTKAWTPARRDLLQLLLEAPFEELVATTDRQIGVRGPVEHAEGGLWAASIDRVELRVHHVRAMVLVENLETFRVLSSLAEHDIIVIHVPGGPPPAECELIGRLAALCPGIAIHAAFDLDPAGIRIALLIEKRTGVKLDALAMSEALLRDAPRQLPLSDWDQQELHRLRDRSHNFEPLRKGIESMDMKAEQEPFQRELLTLLARHYSCVGAISSEAKP